MFNTFRRYQKRWLAALTIMAMIGFAFPVTSFLGGSNRLPPKKANEVVGNLYGRNITHNELEGARYERQVANMFVLEILVASGNQWAPMIPRFAEFFGSTRDDEFILDAIRLTHKADELGIKVNDDMVRDWIKAVTSGKLTTDQFNAVVSKMNKHRGDISAEILFDILRRQLRIERVADLAIGRFRGGASSVTPYEAWQFYRRLNDRLGLEIISVPVSSFADQIDDPGDAVLAELFDKYKSRLPNPTSPEPGFKEPRRVHLQYATASLDAFALALKPEIEVKDEEVKQYYETHKDFYRVLPSAPKGEQEPVGPAEVPEKPKIETPKPEDDEKDKPSTGKEADGAKQEEPKPSDAPSPTEQKAAVEKKSQESEPEEPAAKEQTKETAKDDDKPSANTESEPAKQDEVATSPTKKEEPPQYKSLEEVTPEIYDKLVRIKAKDELVKRMEKVQRMVDAFTTQVYLPALNEHEKRKEDQPDLRFEPPNPPQLSKQIEELGLRFAETGLVSLAEDLPKIEGLGEATEMVGESSSGRSVVAVMASADIYEALGFSNFREDFFTAWKVADVSAKEPAFLEVREQVLAAYRSMKARDLAKARADKLADLLRELGGDIAKLREAQAGVETITIQPIPLWANAAQFSPNNMFSPGRIEPTVLPGITFPTDEMRSRVFKLKEAEAVVAANQPENSYYVVLVTKREPATYEGFARSRFIIEKQVQEMQRQAEVAQWLNDLRKESTQGKVKAPAGN